ncbi:hypothetical protein V9T40_000634 [Parthenolecanium corni]|uniref:Uncharacterized protein n=1 Tax=Parthenolecanium corni TaxID=536013 RepID=A0AAN9TA53_9HEMI
MGDYELPARGPLKLKIDGGIKKKKKEKKKILEQINNAIEKKVSEKSEEPKLTNAEKAFLKQQEKLVRHKAFK